MKSPISIAVIATLLVVYIALRALAWSNTYLFEDHDSILYLQQIDAYLSLDSSKIRSLSPDSTPFYPMFGALLSAPGWSVEAGARLTSLLFSVVLFIAAAGILRRVATPMAGFLGLATLTFSPYLVTFSISILSEPAYVAVIYVGLWYFLARYDRNSLRDAVVLGVIYGLAFLNRLEALLFLVLIPVFQCLWLMGRRLPRREIAIPCARWSLVYAVSFLVVAIPQVLIVSDKMDRFALNGREVWAEIQLSDIPGSYDQKIYGLDYSKTEINLTYLQRVPTDIVTADAGPDFTHRLETILRNIDKFYSIQIGKIGGSLLIAFFLLGLISIHRSGRSFDALVLFLFAGAALVPGILTDPKPRAIAAAVPIFAMLSGPGMLFIATQLEGVSDKFPTKRVLPPVLLAALILFWSVPLLGIYLKERRENVEYSLIDLQPFSELVADIAARNQTAEPVMMARKQYLSHLSGADFVPLPYTDFKGLLQYGRANGANLVFLEYRQIGEYPFMPSFQSGTDLHGVSLIHAAEGGSGHRMELYRLD